MYIVLNQSPLPRLTEEEQAATLFLTEMTEVPHLRHWMMTLATLSQLLPLTILAARQEVPRYSLGPGRNPSILEYGSQVIVVLNL